MISFSIKPKLKLFVTDQDILDSVEIQNQAMGSYLVSEVKNFIQANNIIDTGAYLNSVQYKTQVTRSPAEISFSQLPKKDELLIGDGVGYAVFIEDGTYAIPARPAFRYTLDTKMIQAQQIGAAQVQKFLVRRANARR